MSVIEPYLRALKEHDATTLHLSSGRRPMLRVRGDVVPIAGESLIDDLALRALLKEALGASRWERFAAERDVDFTLTTARHGRFVGHCALTELGVAATFQRLADGPVPLDDLRVPALARELLEAAGGLLLIYGAAGASTSITRAAVVDHLNATRRSHIISIEAPITIYHRSQRSVVQQREVGRHTASFEAGIVEAVDHGADVVVVSDVSEPSTIRAAVDAAAKGTLVIAEMAAPSVLAVIEAASCGAPKQLLSSTRACFAESLIGAIGQVLCTPKSGAPVPAFEVFANVQQTSAWIAAGAIDELDRWLAANNDGVSSLDDSLQALLNDGLVDAREAHRRARDKKRFPQ